MYSTDGVIHNKTEMLQNLLPRLMKYIDHFVPNISEKQSGKNVSLSFFQDFSTFLKTWVAPFF